MSSETISYLGEASEKQDLVDNCVAAFKEQYGREPTHAASTPGRLNFIGEHVDYNDGFVLPAAIEKWVTAAYSLNDSGLIRLYSANLESGGELDPRAALEPVVGDWMNYCKGVIAQFRKREIDVPGFDAAINSNIPLGGGLSSSAALEVVFASIIESLLGIALKPMEKALLCQKAEHEYAGVPCGIMDQAAVTMGKEQSFLKIDCRDLSVSEVPFVNPSLSLIVVDSKVQHNLADGEYAKRRAACKSALEKLGLESYRDATLEDVEGGKLDAEEEKACVRHVVSEIDRTQKAIAALEASEWEAVGKYLDGSHYSLRDDYKVSCAELDFITETARGQAGVYGSRMMGGGFGGSAIVLVDREASETIAQAIGRAYKKRFGLDAGIFQTRPADGAMFWEL